MQAASDENSVNNSGRSVRALSRLFVRRRLSDLLHDTSGTSIIELAFIAPLLSAMVLGVTDLGRGFSAKLELTQAAQSSISKVMQTSFQSSELESLKKTAAVAASVEPSAVRVDFWLTCGGIKQGSGNDKAAFDASCPGQQNPARYVEIEITKKYVPMFSKLHLFGSDIDGSYTLRGGAGLRVQ